MTSQEGPLYLQWVFFTAVLAALFGTALVLGVAESVDELLFLVAVALSVSVLHLPGIRDAVGDDRIQLGALFLAMGVTLVVLNGAGVGSVLFVAIGTLFIGLCVRDGYREAGESTASAP